MGAPLRAATSRTVSGGHRIGREGSALNGGAAGGTGTWNLRSERGESVDRSRLAVVADEGDRIAMRDASAAIEWLMEAPRLAMPAITIHGPLGQRRRDARPSSLIAPSSP